jgi:hypothetical protein
MPPEGQHLSAGKILVCGHALERLEIFGHHGIRSLVQSMSTILSGSHWRLSTAFTDLSQSILSKTIQQNGRCDRSKIVRHIEPLHAGWTGLHT